MAYPLRPATLHRALGPAMAAVLASGACGPDARSVTVLGVSFPAGGPRVVLDRDGETRLYYGALPSFRRVESGTFDIDELASELEGRLHPVVPTEERRPGAPWGMVSLRFEDGRAEEHILYDGDWAEGVFRRACANGIATEGSPARELYDRVCAEVSETASLRASPPARASSRSSGSGPG